MNRREFLKIMTAEVSALTGGPLFSGCSWKNNPNQPRLVMLYATCSVNKYCLSPYNSNANYTPFIKNFASQSAVFNAHTVECGQSGIAYASLFSGCQADRHGIFNHPRKIHNNIFLISDAYAKNGYDVFFWAGHPMANYKLNYGQSVKPDKAFNRMLIAEDIIFKQILSRLSSDKNYKVFIITNFSVTHAIYYPVKANILTQQPTDIEFERFWDLDCLPEEFKKTGLAPNELNKYGRLLNKQNYFSLMYNFDSMTKKIGLTQKEKEKFIKTITYTYKVNIARLDRLFGRVIKKIDQQNLMDDSLVVFTADHGETLYRNNTFFKFTHGYQLAPEVLTVPLIIRGPALGVKSGNYNFVTRSIDVFPTMAQLSNITIPQKNNIQGIDLSVYFDKKTNSPTLPAYSHTALIHSFQKGVVQKSDSPLNLLYPDSAPELMWVSVRLRQKIFKIAKFSLDNPTFQPALFDIQKDPMEKNNLFDSSNEFHQKILDDLRKYKIRLVTACKHWYKITDPGISVKERIKKLKSLGYIK